MSITVTPRTVTRHAPKALRTARSRDASRQQALRDRRKARYAEVLRMLEALGDDEVIVIEGRK